MWIQQLLLVFSSNISTQTILIRESECLAFLLWAPFPVTCTGNSLIQMLTATDILFFFYTAFLKKS